MFVIIKIKLRTIYIDGISDTNVFEIHVYENPARIFTFCLNNFCNNSILLIVLIFAALFATSINKKIPRRKKRALKKVEVGGGGGQGER